jgi:hypothetical protein
MIDFDNYIYDEVQKRNGYYQRYSDDIILICDQKDEEYFYNLLRTSIEILVKLEIQEKKTNIYRYSGDSGKFCGGLLKDGVITSNKQLEYLGFVYNGENINVKTVGFSKFYRSMKRAFRRGIHFASKPENKSHNLFERRLYNRFTYKGAKRRLIYKPVPNSATGFSKTIEQYWGNYISYLEKANRVMKQINGDDSIKNQYSKFWTNFNKQMKIAYKEIGKKVLQN